MFIISNPTVAQMSESKESARRSIVIINRVHLYKPTTYLTLKKYFYTSYLSVFCENERLNNKVFFIRLVNV